MTDVDWHDLESQDGEALKLATFRALQSLSLDIQDRDDDDPYIQSSVPRLAELIDNHPELHSFRPVLSTLARAVGLWNFIDPQLADAKDRLLAEAARPNREFGVVLHREQVEALNVLLSGRNLVLSAPTSFGKSLLVDVLLATGRYKRVAIILPTIALLDEFRKRLIGKFGGSFRILMHHSETAEEHENVIFLGTQERLINRDDISWLDLLVVDEFYKLDPRRKDDRSMTLNATVYKLIKRSNQFFFLGPNIDDVSIDRNGKWKFDQMITRFSTVAVDIVDLRKSGNRVEALKKEVSNPVNWPALVFVSGPDAANTLSAKIASAAPAASQKATELALWLKDNFGPAWKLAQGVENGVGLHHGRVPRSVAAMMVRMFNSKERHLPILLCTSTLIEGVNTAAKSIMIYDKVIDGKNYDFFTFSNIRGRAGRLGEHLVGRVFLFHAPPENSGTEVQPAVFQDLSDAPDELLVHVEPSERSQKATLKILEVSQRLGLPIEDVKRLSSVGFDNLFELRRVFLPRFQSAPHLFIWHRMPDYDQMNSLSEIICEVGGPHKYGVASAAQMTRYFRDLRGHATFRSFFKSYADGNSGYEKYFENIFKFLRMCEYTIPEYMSAIERFAKSLRPEIADSIDFSLFTGEVSRWFQPDILKGLEEQGVPIQISERFHRDGDTIDSLAARLRALALDGDEAQMSALESDWILGALPQADGDRILVA